VSTTRSANQKLADSLNYARPTQGKYNVAQHTHVISKARSFLDGISYAKIHVFHGAYDSGLSETRQGAPVELFSKTLIYLQGFGDTELYVIGIRIFIVNV